MVIFMLKREIMRWLPWPECRATACLARIYQDEGILCKPIVAQALQPAVSALVPTHCFEARLGKGRDESRPGSLRGCATSLRSSSDEKCGLNKARASVAAVRQGSVLRISGRTEARSVPGVHRPAGAGRLSSSRDELLR